MRKPSQHTIDLYNQLVERQNEVRKTLKKIHKRAEEALGAGRLPSLVMPTRTHKLRTNQFEGLSPKELQRRLKKFWTKYREAKALFGAGLRSYLAHTVKRGYVDLWREQLQSQLGLEGEGYNGRFTDLQMKEASESDRLFMEAYNRMISLPAEMFYVMLMRGEIIQFQFIYQEMTYGTRDKENSWISQQLLLFDKNRGWKKQIEAFRAGDFNVAITPNPKHTTLERDYRDERKPYVERNRSEQAGTRHTKETIEKAEKRAKR